jgi:ATP/maltotriose-dependent transcriptional regulator MalT
VQDRSLEHLAATAEHFERAGDRRQAADYFAHAARAASERYANDAALENTRRALDNIDADDVAARFAMLSLREKVFDVLGQREAQAKTLDEIEGLAPPGVAPEQEATLAIRRALLADRSGDFARALAYCARPSRSPSRRYCGRRPRWPMASGRTSCRARRRSIPHAKRRRVPSSMRVAAAIR